MKNWFNLFLRIFSVARIKANMQLKKLETAEIKGARIRERLEEEAAQLRKNRVQVQKDLNLYEMDIKKLKEQVVELEGYLLAADDTRQGLVNSLETASEDDARSIKEKINTQVFNMSRMNNELSTLEAQISELEKAKVVLEKVVDDLNKQADTFRIQSEKAEQVVRLAQTRYRTAQTLLKTNHGRLSPDLLNQIKEIERDAEELTAEAEANRIVYDEENKTDLETIKAGYKLTDTVGVEDRLSNLRNKKK